MDLAESVLNELIILQKKNEELARIITKLEHESDVIIRQFEHKITELQGFLKHEQDERARAGRRHEAAVRELEGAKNALIHEIRDVRETYQVRITSLEEQILAQTEHLRVTESEHAILIQEKDSALHLLEAESQDQNVRLADLQTTLDRDREEFSTRLIQVQDIFEADLKKLAEEIYRKDQEITTLHQNLLESRKKLAVFQENAEIRDEEFKKTLDLLHDQAGAERKIRIRELKERDLRIRELEDTLSEVTHAHEIGKQQADDERRSLLIDIDSLKQSLDTAVGEHEQIVAAKNEGIADLTNQVVTLEELLQTNQKITSTEIERLTNLIEETSALLEKERRVHEELLGDKNEEIHLRDEEVRVLTQKLDDADTARQKESAEASVKIRDLEILVQDQVCTISDIRMDCDQLRGTLQTVTGQFTTERAAMQSELSGVQAALRKDKDMYGRHVETLSASLDAITHERDTIAMKIQESEGFYRQEVRKLHDEIDILKNQVISYENLLAEQTTHREQQVLILSTNNESLRSELERIRSQYNHLQDTIQGEKDESVHALYREISELYQKVADKNGEIETLSEKVLRLDAENTRLSSLSTNIQKTAPGVPEKKSAPPLQIPEPDIQRKKMVTLIAALDHPASAPDAARELVAMGSGVVDLLISLLHSGSSQHRVWIAVVLYELHDNRATIPLKKLLETPGVNFREMIWEARSLYHTGNGRV
ncbi:MAG TPA: hypothetical protein VN372_11845 [Methanospirillum sp.]|nr:hypothetical protein [Methanospirillum sp.]